MKHAWDITYAQKLSLYTSRQCVSKQLYSKQLDDWVLFLVGEETFVSLCIYRPELGITFYPVK
jgi:hypothetical protein